NTAASADPAFDPTHIICNVFIKLTTGDGFYSSGRSGTRLLGVWSGNGCGGTAYNCTFDTDFTDCHADGAGLGGWYISHSSVHLSGCKSYNSGKVLAWTTAQNWSAGQGAVYSGSLYIAKNALTNDTTAPSSDPTNWS